MLSTSEGVDFTDLVSKLATREEVSIYVLCSDNKYSITIPMYRVPEGSDYLLLKEAYCRNAYLILSCFENIDFKASAQSSAQVCISRGDGLA